MVISALLLVGVAIAGLVAAFFLFQSDQQVHHVLEQLVGSEHRARIEQLLLPARLSVTRWLAVVAFLVVGLVVKYLFWPRIDQWAERLGEDQSLLKSRRRQAKEVWQALPIGHRLIAWVGFGLVLANLLWFWYQMPLWEDEVVSYVSYASRGFLVTASYYSEPNNHVFFNLVVGVFRSLEWIGASPQVSFRLPSLLAFLGTLGVVFRFLLLRKGFLVALLGAGFLTLSYRMGLYATQGRGYELQVFLLACLLIAGVRWRADDLRLDRRILILCSVLGLWAVPTFLYPFLVVFGFLGFEALANKNWPRLRTLLRIGAWITAWALLLYAPIILVNGLEALVSNRWVTALSPTVFWAELPAYLGQTNAWLWGLDSVPLGWVLTGAVVGLSAWFGLCHYGKRTLLFMAAALTLPLGLALLQHQLAPERVWLPASFLFFLLLGFLVARLVKGMGWWALPVGLALWLLGFVSLVVKQHHVLSDQVEELCRLNATADEVIGLAAEKGLSTIDLAEPSYLPYLDYEALRQEAPLRVETTSLGGSRLLVTPDTLASEDWQLQGSDSRVRWYLRR